MSLFINPGSGPVADASAANARHNMAEFIADLTVAGHQVLIPVEQVVTDDGGGRWTFYLIVDGTDREIAMPGLPLDRVRWMDEPDQNIWDFPRLYVDGSSWVWKFALDACGPEDDEWDDE